MCQTKGSVVTALLGATDTGVELRSFGKLETRGVICKQLMKVAQGRSREPCGKSRPPAGGQSSALLLVSYLQPSCAVFTHTSPTPVGAFTLSVFPGLHAGVHMHVLFNPS